MDELGLVLCGFCFVQIPFQGSDSQLPRNGSAISTNVLFSVRFHPF